MVDRGRLESDYTGNSIGGSNPPSSVSTQSEHLILILLPIPFWAHPITLFLFHQLTQQVMASSKRGEKKLSQVPNTP